MRRRRVPALVLAATVVLLVTWIGGAPPAGACSCAHDPGLTEADYDAAAEIIIVGRATEVIEHGEGTTGDREYRVDVEALHKGEIFDPVSLFTAKDSAACGESLELGPLYKLYPRRGDDGRYRISLCDWTRFATDADLQPPPPPTTATTAPTSTTPSTTATTAAPTTTSTTTTLPSTSSTPSTVPPPTPDVASVPVADDDDVDVGWALPAAGAGAALAVFAGALAVRRLRGAGPPT